MCLPQLSIEDYLARFHTDPGLISLVLFEAGRRWIDNIVERQISQGSNSGFQGWALPTC